MTLFNSILHRSFFEEFSPTGDPYLKFLGSWREQLPEFKIMKWNSGTFDVNQYDWSYVAYQKSEPVFISELVRWKALNEYGGMYLDADCEIVNGKIIRQLIAECENSEEYDAFLGVEDLLYGATTAQSIFSKPGSEVTKFMLDLYANRLTPLWEWRNSKLLIGPQLLSLFFRKHGGPGATGYFPNLENPVVIGRVKVYPADYFSPKYGILGQDLRLSENTCVYHSFTNLNVKFETETLIRSQQNPMLLHEYLDSLRKFSTKGEKKNQLVEHMKRVTRMLKHSPLIISKIKQVYREI